MHHIPVVDPPFQKIKFLNIDKNRQNIGICSSNLKIRTMSVTLFNFAEIVWKLNRSTLFLRGRGGGQTSKHGGKIRMKIMIWKIASSITMRRFWAFIDILWLGILQNFERSGGGGGVKLLNMAAKFEWKSWYEKLHHPSQWGGSELSLTYYDWVFYKILRFSFTFASIILYVHKGGLKSNWFHITMNRFLAFIEILWFGILSNSEIFIYLENRNK